MTHAIYGPVITEEALGEPNHPLRQFAADAGHSREPRKDEL
ncbi:hypothetical protein [Paenarthrobacter nicotinovorans]|nr:hypothetical protein [Paenarthrobacter nicotinovorans]